MSQELRLSAKIKAHGLILVCRESGATALGKEEGARETSLAVTAVGLDRLVCRVPLERLMAKI